MENIMHIGAKVGKEDVDNLVSGIERVFDSGFKNHMEQDTVVQALNIFARTFEVKSITVTNSTFVGEDNKVAVNTAKEQHPDNDYTIKA